MINDDLTYHSHATHPHHIPRAAGSSHVAAVGLRSAR